MLCLSFDMFFFSHYIRGFQSERWASPGGASGEHKGMEVKSCYISYQNEFSWNSLNVCDLVKEIVQR